MELRKIIHFSSANGVTIPKPYLNALKINSGDYIEMYLRSNRSIVIKPHRVEPKKITIDD